MKRCENCDCGKNIKGREAGESVWEATSNAPSYSSLSGEVTVDVAIVGGGITGLTTAYLLQKAGKKVAVIEGSRLGQGVTGYTSAHLTFVLDSKFQELIRKFGVQKIKKVQQSNQTALDTIERIVKEESIDCEWKNVDGYLYTETEKDDQLLQDEMAAAKKLGINATYTKDIPIPFPTFSGIHFPNQAQFHPLKYIYGLASVISARGGLIFEGTRVTNVKGNIVETDKGNIHAKDVVLATHAPILSRLLTVQAKTAPYRSYIVGARIEGSTPPGLFWDMDKPYQYIRTAQDSKGSVVVIGGKDHQVGKAVDTRTYTGKLEEYARKRFKVQAIDYAWSAQYFHPVDDLPYIGQAPFYKHLYVATGYSGNGLTFGTVAALVITDLIQGKANAWSKIYSPSRVSVAGLWQLTKYGWNNFKHVVFDRISSQNNTAFKERSGEEGAIITEGGKKVALYRDAQGNVTKLSPVCTHAGCIVQWNAFEKTWDCPCHGGRYNPMGKVINGPPVKDLAKIS